MDSYYAARREEILAKRRAYYAAHRDEIRAKAKDYYNAHADDVIARATAWNREHAAERRARQRKGVVGSPMTCAMCDRVFPRRTANQLFCKRCQRDARAYQSLAWHRERRAV